jgi:phosphatidylinositol alpha 1,6-mannosyltransferase
LVPARPEGADLDSPAVLAADAQLRSAVVALTDNTLRARLAAAARPSMLRRTWSAVGEELLVHYAQVIDGHADARAA